MQVGKAAERRHTPDGGVEPAGSGLGAEVVRVRRIGRCRDCERVGDECYHLSSSRGGKKGGEKKEKKEVMGRAGGKKRKKAEGRRMLGWGLAENEREKGYKGVGWAGMVGKEKERKEKEKVGRLWAEVGKKGKKMGKNERVLMGWAGLGVKWKKEEKEKKGRK